MRLKTAVCLLVSVVLGLSALGFAAANTTTESPFISSIKSFMGVEASAQALAPRGLIPEPNSPAATGLIAGWDYQTTTNGGTAVAVAPNTPATLVANFGTGTMYLNGTNGSSTWITATSGNELTAFGGTAVNAGTGFSTVTTSPAALAVVGGTANSANGKSAAFKFSMSGKQNLVVSYATQGTASGFTTQTWQYSTDGTNWTTAEAVSSIPTSFAAKTLATITGLDNAPNAYLRVTFTGATASSGNNRLDNLQLVASDIPPPPVASTMDIGVDRPNGSLQGQNVTFNAVLSANAATAPDSAVLWQQAHNISGDSDVSTAGTFVSGGDVAGTGPVTVNGVTFQPLPAGGATADGFFSFATGEPNGSFNQYGNANPPFSNLSANYQSLLTTGNFGSGNSVMTLNLNNLTVGATYQIEVWYNDSRGGNQGMTATSGSDSVHAWGNTTATVGGTGQWVIGTFTAGAATKTITFQGDAGAGTLTNAFLLRQLSQPVVPLAGKTVEFRDGDCSTGTVIGSAATNSRGLASVTTNTLSVATHTITACFAGDASYLASSKNLTFVVNGVPTITLGPPAFTDFGSVKAGSFSPSQGTSLTAQYLGSESIYCFYPNFNFQFSTDNVNWNYQGILIPTSGGSYNGTLYVRFSPQTGTPGAVGGSITCQSNPSALSPKSLAVSGTDLVPPQLNTQPSYGIEGQPYSYNLAYPAYPAPTCSRVGGDQWPTGLTLGSNCLLSGTPSVGTMGTYHVTVNATNGVAPDFQNDITLQVYGSPIITNADHTSVAEGAPLNFQFTANSNPQNVWSLGPGSDPLPTGISFNGGYTGTLTGTPAFGTAGVYHLNIQANSGFNTVTTQAFTLTITPAPPTAWWAANGDARDITGNGFDGTLLGGASYAVGKVGQAFKMNGSDSSISVPTPPVTATDNWTMEAWISLSSLNQQGMVMSNGFDNGSTGDGYAFGIGNGCTGPSCYTSGNRLQALYGGVSFLDGGFTFANANQWYHVAMVRESGTLKFYVNGVQTPQTHTIAPTTPTQFRIGSQNGVRFFNGLVDEPTIYNHALSQSEIQSIYNAGVAGKPNSVVTPTGTNVSSNDGGDATVTFANVTASGLTDQVPIDGSQYPPTPQIPLGLYYDISTTATYTGGVAVCFHLPLVNGQATFNNLRIDHFEGGAWVDRTNLATINFASRTICTNSLSSLSPFAIVSLTPTAAGVTVSGRVLAAGGAGLRNATVVMTDENGETRRVVTNAFGTYVLSNVTAGHSYIMGVESRRARYATRVVQVSDTLSDVDFFPEN